MKPTTQKPSTKPAARQNHLAAIHIAQKALGLSSEDAAALKLAVVGVASAAQMSAPQRSRYLAHLATMQARAALARGETPAYTPRPPRAPLVRNVDDAGDLQWGKARALWHALHQAGHVRTNTDAALQAYATRQTRVSAWRFQTQPQITQVIEALKKWALRCGVPSQ